MSACDPSSSGQRHRLKVVLRGKHPDSGFDLSKHRRFLSQHTASSLNATRGVGVLAEGRALSPAVSALSPGMCASDVLDRHVERRSNRCDFDDSDASCIDEDDELEAWPEPPT